MKLALGSVDAPPRPRQIGRSADSLGGQLPLSRPSSWSLGDGPFRAVGVRLLVMDPKHKDVPQTTVTLRKPLSREMFMTTQEFQWHF